MYDHTFVVLAYKDSPYLPECIESLKKQTIQSNIIIATSTPSDYIRCIAEKFDIQMFVTEYGKGVVHDNNFGFRQVKTKYVTMTHQDDLYLPSYAETCVAAANKFKDTLICFTNYAEIMDGKDRQLTFMLKVKRFILSVFMPFKSHLSNKFWKMRLLSLGNPIALPTIMFNLENLPGFQFSEALAQHVNTIDWQTWCNMAKMEGRFFYVKKVLLKRRIHADSLSSAGLENNSRYIEDLNMFRQFWPGFIAKFLARIYASSYTSNAVKK
jgi:hypothetical protein